MCPAERIGKHLRQMMVSFSLDEFWFRWSGRNAGEKFGTMRRKLRG